MRKRIIIISISIFIFVGMLVGGYSLMRYHIAKPCDINGLKDMSRSTDFILYMNDFSDDDAKFTTVGLRGYTVSERELTFIQKERIFNLIESCEFEEKVFADGDEKVKESKYTIVVQFQTEQDEEKKPTIAFSKDGVAFTGNVLYHNNDSEINQFNVPTEKIEKLFDNLYDDVKKHVDVL